jgi:hypothetical protein
VCAHEGTWQQVIGYLFFECKLFLAANLAQFLVFYFLTFSSTKSRMTPAGSTLSSRLSESSWQSRAWNTGLSRCELPQPSLR